jgi:hypothetical protein
MGDEYPVETIRRLPEVSEVDRMQRLGQTAQGLFKVNASA